MNELGERLRDPLVLERIKALAIPPMWRDVWICQVHNGHLQATGFDDRGRKQYRYHDGWIAYRQLHKFSRMAAFGLSLPKIRHQVSRDLMHPTWDKPKALAAVVTLLDRHYLRIGNATYTDQNQTYGITTLRKKHLQGSGGKLSLHYRAKSGKMRTVQIASRKLQRLINSISELPGQELFHYVDSQGDSHSLTSHDVNDYIRDLSGEEFTAKDFRTWGGTVLALDKLAEARARCAENPRLSLERELVKAVAEVLGNTVAVCRKYYIHPKVIAFAVDTDHPDPIAEGMAALPKPAGTVRRDRSADALSPAEQLALAIVSDPC